MLHNQNQDKQIQILRFMQATECQSYEQAQLFLVKYEFILQNAINGYFIERKKQQNQTGDQMKQIIKRPNNNRNIQRNQRNEGQDSLLPSLTPEQLYLLEQQLRQRARLGRNSTHQSHKKHQQNKNCFEKLFKYCRNSFKCFKTIKKTFYKKVNPNKYEAQTTHQFNEIYYDELLKAQFNISQMIEIYQLINIQQSHIQKIKKKQKFKPIFALIVANRKSNLISNFFAKREVVNFLRQNFEIFFMTLSQLKDLSLSNQHQLHKISRCPTVLIYAKNILNLEDVFDRFQGQTIKQIAVSHLQNALQQQKQIFNKWSLVVNLQQQLLRNLTLQSEYQYFQDYQELEQNQSQNSGTVNLPHFQQEQNKRSLIQQQTRIYQQMLNQQSRRKKSIEQQKRKIEEMKQERQLRRLSLPEEPGQDQLANAIEFKFRCPLNGQYIVRRFLNSQKVDILYQYVDTNDNIEFQSDPQRSFELFMSFPPICLSNKRESYLSQIFDQEKQNILIRQI